MILLLILTVKKATKKPLFSLSNYKLLILNFLEYTVLKQQMNHSHLEWRILLFKLILLLLNIKVNKKYTYFLETQLKLFRQIHKKLHLIH